MKRRRDNTQLKCGTRMDQMEARQVEAASCLTKWTRNAKTTRLRTKYFWYDSSLQIAKKIAEAFTTDF